MTCEFELFASGDRYTKPVQPGAELVKRNGDRIFYERLTDDAEYIVDDIGHWHSISAFGDIKLIKKKSIHDHDQMRISVLEAHIEELKKEINGLKAKSFENALNQAVRQYIKSILH